MSVTAILVTYHSAEVIGGALPAIRDSGEVTRCIVVDNASGDGTAAAVRTAWPEAECIENKENVGFGCANNQALAQVETEFALLVNPDARLDSACIRALLAAAARYPDAGILAPRLRDAEGRELHTYKRGVFQREQVAGRWQEPEGDLCAEFLSGAVWLVRMSAIRPLGGFDPNIFLYYEDDDLCLRVRAAGYACVLTADAAATHWVGKSSASGSAGERFRQRHMAWSRLYLQEKYYGKGSARQLAARLALRDGLKWLAYKGRPRQARYGGRLEGIWRYLRSRP